MNPTEQRQTEAVISAAREFVRTADEFFPEDPSVLSEPLQYLQEALDRLGTPEWEPASGEEAFWVSDWRCSGCGRVEVGFSKPERCECVNAIDTPVLPEYAA